MYFKKAAALKYEQNQEGAPILLAKGKGYLAERIVRKAAEFGIPLFKNEALVDSLLDVNIDEKIPPRLYKAVVEVFIWLMKTEEKAKNSQK